MKIAALSFAVVAALLVGILMIPHEQTQAISVGGMHVAGRTSQPPQLACWDTATDKTVRCAPLW